MADVQGAEGGRIQINEVEYLLKNKFSLMSAEEKNEVKRLGPHRPKDIIITQKDKRQSRTFCVSWFEKKRVVDSKCYKKSTVLFSMPAIRGRHGMDSERCGRFAPLIRKSQET